MIFTCIFYTASFPQTYSLTTTVWILGSEMSVSEMGLVSETGAKMVCEAAASRTDDVETVGVSETNGNVPSETGTEIAGTDTVMDSEDKGIV